MNGFFGTLYLFILVYPLVYFGISTYLFWFIHLYILVHPLFKWQNQMSLLYVHYFCTILLEGGNIFYSFNFLHKREWCFQFGFLRLGLIGPSLDSNKFVLTLDKLFYPLLIYLGFVLQLITRKQCPKLKTAFLRA
jgi:hypothetical protein